MQRNREGESVTVPDSLSRTDIIYAINEWIIGKNGERDRAILYRRLVDGITYERIAEEFDLSVRYTKHLIYKREEILFRHLPG